MRLHLGSGPSSVLTSQYSSTGAKSLDLSYQVDEFKDLCYGWKECKPEYNSISITHLRAYVFLSLASRPEVAWKSLTRLPGSICRMMSSNPERSNLKSPARRRLRMASLRRRNALPLKYVLEIALVLG